MRRPASHSPPLVPPSPTHTTARSDCYRTQMSATIYVSVRRVCLHIDGLATRCACPAPLSTAQRVASTAGPRPAQPAPHTYNNTHTRPQDKVPCALLSTCRHAPKPSPTPVHRHLHLITQTLRPHCRPYSSIQCRVSKNASSRRNCTTVTYHSAPGGRSPVCAAIGWCTRNSKAATHASRQWMKSQLLACKSNDGPPRGFDPANATYTNAAGKSSNTELHGM